MPIEAELKRKPQSSSVLVPWELADDTDSPTGRSDPTIEQGLRTRIGNVSDAEAGETGDASAISLLKKIRTRLKNIFDKLVEIHTDMTDGSQVTSVNNFPATQNVDVTDDPTREVGKVSFASGSVVDIADETNRELGRVTVLNPTPATETGLAKEATLQQIKSDIQTEVAQETTLQQILGFYQGGGLATETTLDDLRDYIKTNTPPITLTSRMKAAQPADGYKIWTDLRGDAGITHWYIAEAPDGNVGTEGDFRGIRMPLNANGDILGQWQTNDAFVWNDRAPGQAGWS